MPVFTFLTMTAGSRVGTNFLLDPGRENRLGRGTDCTVILTDPLCSRVHAVVLQRDGQWAVEDRTSRNGTFVNGQKIDDAVLGDGHLLRIGSTEFVFRQSDHPPTLGSAAAMLMTQTIIKDARVDIRESDMFAIAPVVDSEQAHDLLLLYQLSIKLLGCAEAGEVIRHALELLSERTAASVVGFLWRSDDGQLKPKLLIPEKSAKKVVLSEALTRMVCDEGKAVWIANQQNSPDDETLQKVADALCVPLVHEGSVLGAVHVYLDTGRFRQSHFDFAISLANITALALVRARQEESLQTDFQRLKARSPGYDGMIGDCPAMVALKGKIERLARATGCVLVRGESGAGKELVARALHRASPRADRPMLSVNCAAIPADLMESQLFGHKAGSFTGADRDHAGYFQQADLGTLFLDEVGEMTLEGQAKLLRILEGHPFLPVGGVNEIHVDVRVIAATNQDLQVYVREKKFREDLYYRLCVFELTIPPLRERGGDVDLLVDFFLDHFRHQHGRVGLGLSDEARARLRTYHWPGNVRQLRNVIDSAVVLADGKQIEPGDLGLRDAGGDELESLRIDVWERRLIDQALKRCGGNIPEAAKLLGIGRATLYRKLDEYGMAK